MTKYGSIYKIINKINNKEYVGQTTTPIETRFNSHCNEKRNRHISNAIRKYGRDNFQIIELCSAFTREDLNELEIYFVEKLNTLHPFGYNHRAGGNQNGVCSDLLKKKISLAKTGKPNLKRRGELRSQKQRLEISRSLGGQTIIAVCIATGCIKIYNTVHETRKDGFNPSNVVSICKNKYGRNSSKGWKFYYEKDYANQSGSLETKKS